MTILKKIRLFLMGAWLEGTTTLEIDEDQMTCRVTSDTMPPPSAPSGLNFSALGNGVIIDWDDNPVSEVVTGYKVFRSVNEGGPFSSAGSPTLSNFTDTTGTANVIYWYRVFATNSGGDSPYSAISAEYTSDTTPPAVPTITSTTQVGVHAVEIDWNDVTDTDLAGYNAYRSTSSGGTYTKLNTTALLSSPTYTDNSATAGSHWYYHVTSVDVTGNESSSAATDFAVPSSDTTPPAVPTNVVALDIHTAIQITWTPNTEPDFASYKIYRSDDGYTTPISTGLTSATFSDSTAVLATSYTYKVLARDSSTNESAKSSASNAATRTTQVTGNLSPYVTSGTMAPCVAHARGVFLTKYKSTPNSDGTVSVTLTETHDFPSLANGNELTARYEWNFASGTNNSQGKYPTGRAFNYAHAYDAPGQYTILLTRTDDTGVVQVFQSTISISADSRTIIYCSSDGDGSSSNGGTDKTKPVNLARANAIIGSKDFYKVLLRTGDVFNISGTAFTLTKDSQVISSDSKIFKGSSTNPPKFVFNTSGTGVRKVVDIQATSRNSVVENIEIDQQYSGGSKTNDTGVVFGASSVNALVRGITYTHIGKPVDVDQSGGNTRFILCQDCIVPNNDSMQYNFLFAKGADFVFLGIKIANSVNEHGIRISQGDRVCIAYCDFTNKELSASDTVKTTTNFQQGSFCYIYKNNLVCDIGTLGSNQAGTCQIGPLNKGTGHVGEFCKYCVMEENTIQAFIEIEDGALYVMVRNNVISKPESYCFQIYGRGEGNDSTGLPFSTRTSDHVYIYNNTCINPGKNGQIIRVKHSFNNFECSNNLLIGPLMVKADSGTIPNEAMYFSGLGTANVVSRNVNPSALDQVLLGSTKYATAQFNTKGGTNNGVDAVTVDGTYKPTFTKGQQALGRPIKGVFSSINGKARNSSDASWTPGAYQL